jgi:hypothetical protein
LLSHAGNIHDGETHILILNPKTAASE